MNLRNRRAPFLALAEGVGAIIRPQQSRNREQAAARFQSTAMLQPTARFQPINSRKRGPRMKITIGMPARLPGIAIRRTKPPILGTRESSRPRRIMEKTARKPFPAPSAAKPKWRSFPLCKCKPIPFTSMKMS